MQNTLNKSNQEVIQELLKDLDDDQKKAVTGPLCDSLCIANAGSGKTRVLTYRVAYLIASGIPEEKIMLLTFTNKAADEMIQRVKKILKKDDIKIVAGTFHHVAGLFLRKYAKVLGFNNNFSIMTPEDSKDLIQLCRQKYLAENEDLKKDFPSKSILYEFYTKSVNLNKHITLINAAEYNYSIRVEKAILEILKDYMVRKQENQCMDFDDLLVYFYTLLSNFPNIRKKISSQYPYILVDEYQDINWLQNEIIELINQDNHCLMAVGDESQTIYSFRGSKIDYINKFEVNHPNCRIYRIRYNYRSQKDIVDLAVDSINNNYHKYPKEMIAFIPNQGKPVILESEHESQQADYIANQIKLYKAQGIPYKEMAVLVRANFLTKTLEMAFQRNSIPYKVLAGISFFDRQHIRDVVAFLKFCQNPSDEVAFNRIASLFSGIGAKTAQKFYEILKEKNFQLEEITEYDIPFKPTSNAYKSIRHLMEILSSMYLMDTVEGKIRTLYELFYNDYMKFNYDDYFGRQKDVETLMDSAKIYADLDTFLADTVLDRPQINKDSEEGEDCVVITTIHKAKGLEWDCVFMPYVNEDIFPSKKSVLSKEVEEERRLFYVGITRAKRYLLIGYVLDSVMFNTEGKPSMFLTELKSKLFDFKVIKSV